MVSAGKGYTMRNCKYCGKQIAYDSKYSPNCGAAFDNSGENRKNPEVDFEGQAKAIFDTPDLTSKMDPGDIYSNKAMAILSYLGFLVLIPLFAAKDSAFARFHASQGLTLFIFEIVFSIMSNLVLAIFGRMFIIGTMFSVVFWIIGVALVGLAVFGIISAAQGKAKELPFIGSIHIIQ